MPVPAHTKNPGEGQRAWVTLRAAISGLHDPTPAFATLPPSKRSFLPLIPEGGNWKNLPRRLQARAIGAAYKARGAETDSYDASHGIAQRPR
jgi:DNA (cytosine-5)-methyltransferase 1